jgi:hypothetical protein
MRRINALNNNTEQNMVGLYKNINKKLDKVWNEVYNMKEDQTIPE